LWSPVVRRLVLDKEMMNEEEMRNILRKELGREPSQLEVEASLAGRRAGQEVWDLMAEMTLEKFLSMTPEEVLSAIKNRKAS
jgi:hypothetical protein